MRRLFRSSFKLLALALQTFRSVVGDGYKTFCVLTVLRGGIRPQVLVSELGQ